MAKTSTEKKLTERAKIIFKALVERYIQSGEPVGSKILAEKLQVSLSSASIRHVLFDLEKQGYLHAPHKSAGRIPTARGYRLFVDSLLTIHKPRSQDFYKIQQTLNPALDTSRLLSAACSLISGITSLTSIATIPKTAHLLLSHVEFLPLADHKILAVLVFNGREVQNRIICADRFYPAGELQQASNYLNAHFSGLELTQLKKRLKAKMQQETQEISRLLTAAIEAAVPDEDFVVRGQSHLLDFAEISDMPRLREVFSAFNQKRDILYLMEQCLRAENIQIYIGEESGYAPLDEYSVVGAPYSIDCEVVGVLAIIGPLRMAYDRVIPALDLTAKLLSAALNQKK